MEHRWGQRLAVNLEVQLNCGSLTTPHCRLHDVSVSGAFVGTALALRLWANVVVVFDDATGRRSTYRAQACVVRQTADGVGIEWEEFAPPGIGALISSASASILDRPHIEAENQPLVASDVA